MTRKEARDLISSKIEEITGGLTINELADSATLCNCLDDMDGICFRDDQLIDVADHP